MAPDKSSRAAGNSDRISASRRRPPWYLIYFILAAFDLLTVSVSLSLNRRLIRVFSESVRVNQEWSERRNRLSKLGELASEVNAPGNDVFDSQNVPTESARMNVALKKFNAAIAA